MSGENSNKNLEPGSCQEHREPLRGLTHCELPWPWHLDFPHWNFTLSSPFTLSTCPRLVAIIMQCNAEFPYSSPSTLYLELFHSQTNQDILQNKGEKRKTVNNLGKKTHWSPDFPSFEGSYDLQKIYVFLLFMNMEIYYYLRVCHVTGFLSGSFFTLSYWLKQYSNITVRYF